MNKFESVSHAEESLRHAGYIADNAIATAVFLGPELAKPILVEGPAGVGKTFLAKCVAKATGTELIRLQCYEGLDEAKALYEWNYRKQLLRIQADEGKSWDKIESSIFSEDFLLERPLLKAIRSPQPITLLIDEVDRTEFEFEAFLLEVLSDFQVSIPEMTTITANSQPIVFLTSNATRELSEALKRRCLYCHIGYPTVERERDIVVAQITGIEEGLATKISEIVASIRTLELKKTPSVAETIDWIRALQAIGAPDPTTDDLTSTLNVLLKDTQDINKAAELLTR